MHIYSYIIFSFNYSGQGNEELKKVFTHIPALGGLRVSGVFAVKYFIAFFPKIYYKK
jgi:hypothetical protein